MEIEMMKQTARNERFDRVYSLALVLFPNHPSLESAFAEAAIQVHNLRTKLESEEGIPCRPDSGFVSVLVRPEHGLGMGVKKT